MAACQTCGRTFTPSAALRERYPDWTPPQCPSCFRSGASGDAATATAARRGGSPHEEGLRLDQVLERYDGGPDTGVFTDGAANPNPGPGGWGAVYVVDGEVIDQARGHEPDTTNNRMELTAILHGIELVPAGTAAVVYSDSKLSVQTLTEWAAGWARRGWRRRTGPVQNLDLVRPLYERLQERPELELRWIKAHAGARWNEYADSLATAWERDTL